MQRTWLIWWALLAAAWFAPGAMAAGSSAADLPDSETPAVRAVIRAQLDAFAADDAHRAFDLASPKIREMFGDANRFVAMVQSNYPAVYRSAAVEFLALQKVDGVVIQPVRLTDQRGDLWLAVYRLERQPDKSWRISGCEVAPLEGRAT